MKYVLIITLCCLVSSLSADCTRADRTHTDSNVVRCSYTQEDIYNCYSKKPTCYDCEQRRNECFYCKCPISEHSKQEVAETCRGNKCPKKGPFDDEIIERRRQKNKRGK